MVLLAAPMPLTENEARKRRLLIKDAFKFMNARVLDKQTFGRSEMFGPESVGAGAIPGFTRRVMSRLVRNEKVVLDNDSSTRPVYKAIQVVKMTDEEIGKYLKYNDEEEELDESPAPSFVVDRPAPQPAPASAPAPDEADEDEEPDTRQMLASLVAILPDVVKAINRIEKRVVAIEVAQRDIAKAVTGQELGTIRGDINGLLELVAEIDSKVTKS